MEWWTPNIEPRLSQGDVLRLVPMAIVAFPALALEKQTISGGRTAWVPKASLDAGRITMLSEGQQLMVIVLSHSCELDKNHRKAHVIVAPMQLASTLTEDVRSVVFGRQRRAFLPLPSIPSIGDCYADLRSMQAIDRRHADHAEKVGSMTAEGLQALQDQVVEFFARG